MTFFITATGESGKSYALYFECDTWEQAEIMCRDAGLTLDGEHIESTEWID